MRPDDVSEPLAAEPELAADHPGWLRSLLQQPHVAPEHYLAHAPPEHRRRWGQHFTPPRIAALLAGWAIQPATRTVLDPAVGTGVLLEAVLADSQLSSSADLVGIDHDPAMLALSGHNLRRFADRVSLHSADFLRDRVGQRFDAIVCNPPYVRHRALGSRSALYAAFEREFGVKLSGFSNSYVLFILRIAAALAPNGRAALITPIDYLNANFGTPIKSYLLRENLLDGLVAFEHRTLVFDDANVAASLVLLRRGRASDEPVRFARSTGDEASLEQLFADRGTLHTPSRLDPAAKWSALFAPPVSPAASKPRRMVALGELMDVRRGIATGANEFFMLTQQQVERAELNDAVRPCVARAMQAAGLRFGTADWERLRSAGAAVYLLDVRGPVSPAVAAYLAEGARRGVDRRYLPAHRHPWYASEARPSAPLWINTFGRRGFRCVWNAAGVANLTAFHALYPKRVAYADLLILAAYLNGRRGTHALWHGARVLGGGLAKLEPLDLTAIFIPDPTLIPDALRRELLDVHVARCAAEGRAEMERLAAHNDALWDDYLGSRG